MPIQYSRLQKIADHLRTGKLGHKHFNFSSFNTNSDNTDFVTGGPEVCGTMGCAVGEFPFIFPKHFAFRNVDPWGHSSEASGPRLRKGSSGTYGGACQEDAERFLGINSSMFCHLFIPSGNPGGNDFDPDSQNPTRYGGRKLKPYSTALAVAKNIEAFIEVMKETKGKGRNAD
jgi:hypothetical protein